MEGIKKENLIVRNIIIGYSIILSWLLIANPPIRGAVIINLVFLGISFFVYNAKEYQDDLFGVKSNIFPSIGYGVLFAFFFYLITLVVPGMSIGLPTLPASISDSLRFFFVVGIAPVTESLMFLGVTLSWISNFDTSLNKKRIYLAVIFSSLLFAIFHISAYISGFYALPNFTAGLTSFYANFSAFFVAFLFNLIAGFFLVTKNVRNIIFPIIFHMGMNFVAFSLSVVVF